MKPLFRRARAELRSLTSAYPVLTLHLAMGATFFVLAGSFAAVTGTLGGLSWVLAWPTLSLVVVSLGYLGLGPWVLGKRRDGTLSWYAGVLLLPYLSAAELAWYIVRVMGREDPWHEVAHGYFLGRRAQHWELPARIAVVVDMTAEFVEPTEVRTGRRYICVPTLDASAPPAERLAAGIAEALAVEGNVYVHCAAGHGRSAMAMAVLLVARGIAVDVDAAVALMRVARVSVSLRTTQHRVAAQTVALLRERGLVVRTPADREGLVGNRDHEQRARR